MRQLRVLLAAWLMVCALGLSPARAQGEFPRVIPFSGTADGNSSPSKPVGITFSIYEAASGGTALFVETQFVMLQTHRRFEVLLGAATPGGLPADLFAANQALFVGIQVDGQPEQTPRTMFASVPYALKAADSDMLGDLPASEYVTEAEAASGNAYTDAQVAAEAALRAAADTTLQSNIDTEAATRAAAGATLQSNIDAEAGARMNADATLQGNIDALASRVQTRVTGSCGAGASMVSVNADGSVNCVSVDTNPGDDITSLIAGAGLSISGSGNTRTLINTGDRNPADDITELTAVVGIAISGSGNSRSITNTGDISPLDDITFLSGSGGIAVTGSGNGRTIGHSTWSCGANSSIRTIGSDGTVVCEPDDVGGGGSVTRSVNLPLPSFLNFSIGQALDFIPSNGTGPDLALSTGNLAIEYDADTDGAGPDEADAHYIGTTFMVPPDYSAGGSLALRVSKNAHTGIEEVLRCSVFVNGVASVISATTTITGAASALYILTPPPSMPYAAGSSATVWCLANDITSNFDRDDVVRIHAVEFRYTATP